MFQITIVYAGFLGLLMAVLSIRVPMRRAAINAPWGDADDPVLSTRIRIFGNFVEYVPAILLLMALVETTGASDIFLHLCGTGLIAARIIHAFSLRHGDCPLHLKIGRAIGAMGTWLILICLSLYIGLSELGVTGAGS